MIKNILNFVKRLIPRRPSNPGFMPGNSSLIATTTGLSAQDRHYLRTLYKDRFKDFDMLPADGVMQFDFTDPQFDHAFHTFATIRMPDKEKATIQYFIDNNLKNLYTYDGTTRVPINDIVYLPHNVPEPIRVIENKAKNMRYELGIPDKNVYAGGVHTGGYNGKSYVRAFTGDNSTYNGYVSTMMHEGGLGHEFDTVRQNLYLDPNWIEAKQYFGDTYSITPLLPKRKGSPSLYAYISNPVLVVKNPHMSVTAAKPEEASATMVEVRNKLLDLFKHEYRPQDYPNQTFTEAFENYIDNIPILELLPIIRDINGYGYEYSHFLLPPTESMIQSAQYAVTAGGDAEAIRHLSQLLAAKAMDDAARALYAGTIKFLLKKGFTIAGALAALGLPIIAKHGNKLIKKTR